MKYFNLRFVYSTLLLSTALFASSCDDDDDNGGNVTPNVDFAGSYEYESAKFAEEVTIDGDLHPAGSSADGFVEEIIKSAGPCDDDDTHLDLKTDGKLFLSCDDDDSGVESGTWSGNGDNTTLTLQINGVPVDLVIENIKWEQDDDDDGDDTDDWDLHGTIHNLPLPIDTSKPLDTDNLQLVNVDIVLDKEN